MARKEDDDKDDEGRSKESGGRICRSGQKMGGSAVGCSRARRRATVTMAVDSVVKGVGGRGAPSPGWWGCASHMNFMAECGGGGGAKPGTVGMCVARDWPGRCALLSILRLSPPPLSLSLLSTPPSPRLLHNRSGRMQGGGGAPVE